jgi:uncharacterized protein (TIGR02271 family)
MTNQAEQLMGARVTDSDGQVVGTVQQIFNDDRTGTPVWARIRAGSRDRFVPLGRSRVTKEGLSVPFGTQQILSGPEVNAERHISLAQTEQLNRHFGLTVPAQGGQPDVGTQRGQAQPGQARPGPAQPGPAQPRPAQPGPAQPRPAQPGPAQPGPAQPGPAQPRPAQPGPARPGQAQPGQAQRGEDQPGVEWLIRAEERVDVGTERLESGRARLHKYVDVEPVEQTVHVFHEEYQVERVPITAEEQVRGVIAEAEQEIILHEERPVFRKETVPVERVRLVAKRVEEDRTLRDEIRRERFEIEADGKAGRRTPEAAESSGGNQRRP